MFDKFRQTSALKWKVLTYNLSLQKIHFNTSVSAVAVQPADGCYPAPAIDIYFGLCEYISCLFLHSI